MKNGNEEFKGKERTKPFIIHEKVEAVVSYYNKNAFHCSKILDDQGVLYLESPPIKVMEESCLYYGSDIWGRWNVAKQILQAKQMLPLTLSVLHDLVMIPLRSPLSSNCEWVSLAQIDSIEAIDAKQTRITFRSGNQLDVALQPNSIETKRYRAAFLRDELIRRFMDGFQDEVPPSIWFMMMRSLRD
ncbi:competence protein ComK [Bacillus tianshenii]|nr:competence protein ComK [Bacillus tianshenii]